MTNIYISILYFRALYSTTFYLLGDKTKEQSDLGKREEQYGLNLFQDWHSYFLATDFLPDIYSNEINSENLVTVCNA